MEFKWILVGEIQRIFTLGSFWPLAGPLGRPSSCETAVLLHASNVQKYLGAASLEILDYHTIIHIYKPLSNSPAAPPYMILFCLYRTACGCYQPL